VSVIKTRGHQLFPVLDPSQIDMAKRFASGPARDFAPGEIVYDVGERNVPAWLVLKGSIDVIRRDGLDHEAAITSLGPGQFSGEVSQLAGAATLASARAGPEGCTGLPFDAAHVRALMIGSAEVGEIMMRAFILRRVGLIEEGGVGSVLVGRPGTPDLVRLQGFLGRNGYPYTVLDASTDAEGRAVVERSGVLPEELPLMVCPNGTILKRPTDAEAGAILGITPELDPQRVYDVAIVGAGPAGLAAAVYAGSEGLSVLVLDQRAFGGQAGASARIENYLGFPTGISGMGSGRAFNQALKFGVEIAIPAEVARLDCDEEAGEPMRLELTNAAWCAPNRRGCVAPAIGDLQSQPLDLRGSGCLVWASPVEAKLCEARWRLWAGQFGGTGRGVSHLGKTLHLVVRGSGLEGRCRAIIDRIAALPNVELHTGTEVVALEGDESTGLTAAVFRERATGATHTCSLRHLFLFIGADPNTSWLKHCVALDNRGFVVTGGNSTGGASRPILSLETSRPGVFAIGDVRAGSTKRVAAAVGEGAAVVAEIHHVVAAEPG
jgi:thioredoxin reductase (NADPH)